MSNYIQIITTTSSKQNAEKIAGAVVKKRLAACAQVFGPIKSTFRWKGRIKVAREWVCFIKTRNSFYKKIAKEIKRIHSYTVPEILSLPIIEGNKSYLNWIDSCLR